MSYVILGRAVKTEYLTLGVLFGTVALAKSLSGGSKETKSMTVEQVKDSVKLGSSSKEEEDLMASIKQFIADAEKDSKH